MPILFLAIASFPFFLLVVVLLYIADTLESRTRDRNRASTCRHGLTLLSIPDAFDPVFSVLWAAPIAALEHIGSAGPAGLPLVALRPIYVKAVKRFPEVHEGCTLLQWVRFLEATELITWSGDRMPLTSEGNAFLRFRFVTNSMTES